MVFVFDLQVSFEDGGFPGMFDGHNEDDIFRCLGVILTRLNPFVAIGLGLCRCM